MTARDDPERVQQEIVAGFQELDVSCISDTVRGLRLNCVYSGLKPLVREWRVCGPALTIRLIPSQDPARWFMEEMHPGSLMNIAKPGDVIVVDQGGLSDLALWGGQTARRAKLISMGGIVIDGAVRDSDEVIAAGVPTFVKSTTPMHGHGLLRGTSYNSEPIKIGTISVAPGDLVCGSSDGIVVVPAARALEILALAQQRHAIDLDLNAAPTQKRANRERIRCIYGLPPAPDDSDYVDELPNE